jgi:L,D-transpeptidase YcbB
MHKSKAALHNRDDELWMKIKHCIIHLFHQRTFFMFFLFLNSCSENREPPVVETATEDSNPALADTAELYIDSIQLAAFLQKNSNLEIARQIRQLYATRNYRYLWLNSAGTNTDAQKVMNLLQNDDVQYHQLDTLYYLYSKISDAETGGKNDSLFPALEVMLTHELFEFAERNWKGNPGISKMIGWFIERKKMDVSAYMDSLLSGGNQPFIKEPVYRQYALLKKYLIRYRSISPEWPVWEYSSDLKEGDTANVLPAIKKQLYLMHDLDSNDTTSVFNAATTEAVKNFQRRHGIPASGLLGKETKEELLVPPDDRIRQLLINMERFRWIPYQPLGRFIAVNIPAFRLLFYQDDTVIWATNIIAGKSGTNTVIFNGTIDEIIFRPSWTVPKSIFVKEIFHEIIKDKRYLDRNDMYIIDENGNKINALTIDWKKVKPSAFPYKIRQRPGSTNALGLIKFQIKNPYGIYLHDTPQKQLFTKENRAFSHGCIRVENASTLAWYILNDSINWNDQNIESAMEARYSSRVKPSQTVPVYITYFTAWADKSGLHFRRDIYGHDQKMSSLLFQ